MTQLFPIKIISPEKLVFDANAQLVEIPGREGDFGVLAKHAPFFSMLRPGVVTVHIHGEAKKRFFVTSGYAEISPDQTVILSDHIEELEQINPDEAREAFVAAQEALKSASDMDERQHAMRRLEAASALVAAVKAA